MNMRQLLALTWGEVRSQISGTIHRGPRLQGISGDDTVPA
jgi:hypothetical protein